MNPYYENDEPDFSDEEVRARAKVAHGFSELAYYLGLSLEDALSPAMHGRGIETCSHMHKLFSTRRTAEGRFVPEEGNREQQVLMCALHPHGVDGGPQLFCQEDVVEHYATQHHGEYDRAVCAVCETSLRSPTGYRRDFTPVFGVVELLKPLPVRYFRPPNWSSFNAMYIGDITTTALTYLCSEHAGAVDLPFRYQWPAGSPTVEPDEQPYPPQAPF